MTRSAGEPAERLRSRTRGCTTSLTVRRDAVSVARWRVATDKDVQDNLRRAVEELRSAADRVQGGGETHKSRKATLLVTGIALGILFNPVTGPDTRKWLKETLLGGSDEFGYRRPRARTTTT